VLRKRAWKLEHSRIISIFGMQGGLGITRASITFPSKAKNE
jgi:hypothetical protein